MDGVSRAVFRRTAKRRERCRSGSSSTSGTGEVDQHQQQQTQPQQHQRQQQEQQLILDKHFPLQGDYPHIEDPFEQARNLGDSVSPFGMARLLEELQRSHELLTRGESLTVLLDPWTPSAGEDGEEGGEGS